MFEGLLTSLCFLCMDSQCVVIDCNVVGWPCCCQELRVSGQESDPAKASRLEIVGTEDIP
jgi:hypothetical protein